jgi:RNA polymerase sigma factor (TIGR02999 family)
MLDFPKRPERADAGLLAAWRAGDDGAADRLVPLVYEALHAAAARHLRAARDGHALRPTALVQEAWQRLGARVADHPEAHDRVHFHALASRVLRRVLLDHARRALAAAREARGHGPMLYVEPDAGTRPADEWALTAMALDDALAELGHLHPRLPRVVECRFFGGLTEAETAEVLHVSAQTVRRDWRRASTWLALRLEG